jgi:beta-glucosidase
MKNWGLLAIALLTATPLHAQQRALYRDPAVPIEQRVEDLLARMTQDEKIAQLTAIWTQKNQLFERDGFQVWGRR